MTKKETAAPTESHTPAEATQVATSQPVPPAPPSGGSYVVEPDGKLTLTEQTQDKE